MDDRLDELRAEWQAAAEGGRLEDAIHALVELEALAPDDPLWPQRLGETYRRMGNASDAILAFGRAFKSYVDRGFLPRAIAMAKLVKALDPARGDLLEAHLAKAADASSKRSSGSGRSHGSDFVGPKAARISSTQTPAVRVPEGGLPLPSEPAPFDVRPERRLVVPVRAAKLSHAEGSSADEVRFDDAPASSLTFSLREIGGIEPVVRVDDEDDDDAPATRPLGPGDSRPPSKKHDPYATMATFRLFAALSPDALLALANVSELVEFAPGAMIIVRDERAFALYGIVSGTARVTLARSDERVRLAEGEIFGEASLLDDGQRQASVEAESALMTLRIEKHALDTVTREYPEVEDALFDLFARRLVANLMTTSPLFRPFDPPDRLAVAQAFEVRRAPAGTTLAESGRRSDGLYVLLAGHLIAQGAGAVVARIARGAVFGHASLLGAGTADYTVRAVTESVVLRMPSSKFTEIAAHYPPVLAHLAETAHEPLPISEREPG